MKIKIRNFMEMTYDLYKIEWCRQRGYDPNEVAAADEAGREYNGAMYVCLDEFEDCEYQDKAYVKALVADAQTLHLYKKLYDDLYSYKQQLLTLPAEKILEQAQEFATKERIIAAYCSMEISRDSPVYALLHVENPLEHVYARWTTVDSYQTEEMCQNIECTAEDLIRDGIVEMEEDW